MKCSNVLTGLIFSKPFGIIVNKLGAGRIKKNVTASWDDSISADVEEGAGSAGKRIVPNVVWGQLDHKVSLTTTGGELAGRIA